jgi:hypothetical protein
LLPCDPLLPTTPLRRGTEYHDDRAAEMAHFPPRITSLRQVLRELADLDRRRNRINETKAGTQTALEQVRGELKKAERNLAFATNEQNFRAVEAVIPELREREKALPAESKSTESRSVLGSDPEAEIGTALGFAERLSELASNGRDFGVATEAFSLSDARLFVEFKPILKKRRTMNQIVGGVVTLGTAAPSHMKKTSPKSATAAQGPCGDVRPQGVRPKMAQRLARHSDINLAMSRSSHTLLADEAEALAATGTDDVYRANPLSVENVLPRRFPKPDAETCTLAQSNSQLEPERSFPFEGGRDREISRKQRENRRVRSEKESGEAGILKTTFRKVRCSGSL